MSLTPRFVLCLIVAACINAVPLVLAQTVGTLPGAGSGLVPSRGVGPGVAAVPSSTISSVPGSLLNAMIQDPELTTLVKLLMVISTDPFTQSLNDPTLSSTVFAPTNKGITNSAKKLKAATSLDPTSLAQNPAAILRIVKNHVIVGQAVSGNQLKNRLVLTSALGQKLRVQTGYLYGIYIAGLKNRVRVTPANNLVGRSYIHKVDGIIIPK